MTAAAFERSDKRATAGRSLAEELLDQPTRLLTMGTVVVLILVIGQLTTTLLLACVIAALFTSGMVRLLGERRATLLQTASIGIIHLGAAMLVAGTV